MKTFFISLWLVIFCVLLLFFINCFYGYFYPIKYKSQITQYAAFFDVKPEVVASIINVESGYKSKRVSKKGAVGLMQIMPATGKWIAEKLGEDFDEGMLFNEEKNIEFGSFYFAYLYEYFQDLNLSICAYNAGMGNVKKWMEDENIYLNGKLLKIPFKETEIYLFKVLKNINYYKNKY